MGIVEIYEDNGAIERMADIVRNAIRDGAPVETVMNHAQNMIVSNLISLNDVPPEIAREAGQILRSRIYLCVFSPWDHYPLDEWGDKLALATHGIDIETDAEEWNAAADALLTPIRDDLIRKGCPEDIASEWTEHIVDASSARAWEMTHSGGHQMGCA